MAPHSTAEPDKGKAEFSDDESRNPSPPPPAYDTTDEKNQPTSQVDKKSSDQKIDMDAITANLQNLNLSTPPIMDLVSPDQCIAHLKLLTAITHLREDVSCLNGAFGYDDEAALAYPEDQREQFCARMREKRWAVFVVKAVHRYSEWWDKCVPTSPLGSGPNGQPKMEDIRQKGPLTDQDWETNLIKTQMPQWNIAADKLPPLGKSYTYVMRLGCDCISDA